MKIMIVDGRELFREGLTTLLKTKYGRKSVLSCSSFPECIHNCVEHEPDVVIIDIDMREKDGNLIEKIHKSLPHTKILVLTHSINHNEIIKAMKNGSRGYLSKDVSLQHLLEVIASVASGEVVIAEPLASSVLSKDSLFSSDSGHPGKEDISGLTEQENKVLTLLTEGASNKQIAQDLKISENTVKAHMRNIFEKLHVHSRQQAISLLFRKNRDSLSA